MIKRIPIRIPNGSQSGEKTHHHDHVILPVSFNTIKMITKTPVKPMPP